MRLSEKLKYLSDTEKSFGRDLKIQENLFNLQISYTYICSMIVKKIYLSCGCFSWDCREHSCCLPHWVYPQCKDTMRWSSSQECHPFGMWCFWCTPTSEQAEPGTNNVPFHQWLHCFGMYHAIILIQIWGYLVITWILCIISYWVWRTEENAHVDVVANNYFSILVIEFEFVLDFR